jgi:hypothetical protein
VLCLVGIAGLAGFLPPPSPADDPAGIVARFHDHATGIRAGMALAAGGFTLIVAWGACIAARTYRNERPVPVLSFIQVTLLGLSLFVGVLFSVAAQLATFRAGDIDPAVTVTLNDATWFTFLIWAPFVLWMLAMAAAVLVDDSPTPALPRWAAWLSLWAGLLSIPAVMIPFFRTGPFAYDGIFAWYVPAAVFFIWQPLVTHALLGSIKRDAALTPGVGSAVSALNLPPSGYPS